jgi:hypothetical protein
VLNLVDLRLARRLVEADANRKLARAPEESLAEHQCPDGKNRDDRYPDAQTREEPSHVDLQRL